ncbi:MAG: ABC transporter ATP-binding protein [Planctomycetes bacterium]|nr:ABC transporter ATP-binding protein [Planctomycetota bacterium]
MARPLLEIRDLRTQFHTAEGVVRAVDGVSWTLHEGEVLGLVGESGCGKSVSAMSILRLNPEPPTVYPGGQVLFRGLDLLRCPAEELRRVRGNQVAMVFQEPMTSLNPVFTVGQQVGEVLELHKGLSRRAAREAAIGLLRQVGIPAPEARVDAWPHQLSGGMQQRVMIAMALACGPALLIADEPTTALDVTIQAQILELLAGLRERTGMAMLLITHSLGVVAGAADRVAVMYAGRIVESAPTPALFATPRHPYTLGLLQSLPEMHRRGAPRLREIPGTVGSPLSWPSGCRFRERCPRAEARCAQEDPVLRELAPGHLAACHVPVEAGTSAAAEDRR